MPLAESTSPKETPLIVSVLSSATVWVPGTVMVGASLTAVTSSVRLDEPLRLPPLPVLPPSSRATPRVTGASALLAVV